MRARIATLGVWACLIAGGARGQAAAPPPPRVPCCVVAAGTPVEIELAEPLSSRTAKPDHWFKIKLAQDLRIDGRTIVAAGAAGSGEVVDAAPGGNFGRPGKLVLAARFLDVGSARLPLRGFGLYGAGLDTSKEAINVGLIVSPILSLAVQGGNIDFPADTRATAKVASDTFIMAAAPSPSPADPDGSTVSNPLKAATGSSPTSADGAAPPAAPTAGHIHAAPPGKAQVVFFRTGAIEGADGSFEVREHDLKLGKLSNQSYFVVLLDPGAHSFTAKTENTTRLKLELDEGETYYVRGTSEFGFLLDEVNLAPADVTLFEKHFAHMHAVKSFSAPPAPTSAEKSP